MYTAVVNGFIIRFEATLEAVLTAEAGVMVSTIVVVVVVVVSTVIASNIYLISIPFKLDIRESLNVYGVRAGLTDLA